MRFIFFPPASHGPTALPGTLVSVATHAVLLGAVTYGHGPSSDLLSFREHVQPVIYYLPPPDRVAGRRPVEDVSPGWSWELVARIAEWNRRSDSDAVGQQPGSRRPGRTQCTAPPSFRRRRLRWTLLTPCTRYSRRSRAPCGWKEALRPCILPTCSPGTSKALCAPGT